MLHRFGQSIILDDVPRMLSVEASCLLIPRTEEPHMIITITETPGLDAPAATGAAA